MRELVVICDTQSVYSRRLMEYISARDKELIEIRLYTSVSLMLNALEGKRIAFLLIHEEGYEEVIKHEQILNVDKIGILISKVKSQGEENAYYASLDASYPSYFDKKGRPIDPVIISRFQSAERIRRLVTNKDGDLEGISTELSVAETKEIQNCKADDYAIRLKNVKRQVKHDVQKKLLVRGMLTDDETIKIIDESISSLMETIIQSEIRAEDRIGLRNSVFYSIRGLDVLEELIADESITEIMVNGEDNIFYERNGQLINSGKSFDSRELLLDIIRKIVSDANRTVNMSSPIVDARLKNGSRVNVVLEPISLEGPILTIRRFPKEPLSADRLISMGAVTEEVMSILRSLVFAGYNILISGSTGSGKTTFLNILSGYIPKDERIITIEDSAELKIMGIKNLVRLETRNANIDGCSEITIRDLIRSALRMRPDRIIVGEVRGAEAIDMLQSFLVGQDGSMSTIHANSAEDALYRLEMLMMINGSEMPLAAIRRQIATGVDIIIQLVRLKDKKRKLYEIREVTGYIDGEIRTSLLYRYENGHFIRHNRLSNTYKLEMAGLKNEL